MCMKDVSECEQVILPADSEPTGNEPMSCESIGCEPMGCEPMGCEPTDTTPNKEPKKTIGRSSLNGFKNGANVILGFLKYIIPSVALIKLLEYTGALLIIAKACEPLMSYIGLPGKAAVVLFMGQLSLYSGIAAISTISMTAKQITICCSFLGSFHAMLLESIVVKRTGGSMMLVALFRFLAALASALVLNWIL